MKARHAPAADESATRGVSRAPPARPSTTDATLYAVPRTATTTTQLSEQRGEQRPRREGALP